MSEQLINIASKFYSSRRALRGLLRDVYAAKVVEWMKVVQAFCETRKVNEMTAALRLAKALTDEGQDMAVMWVLAATCELIEPDDMTPVLDECVMKGAKK